MIQSKDSEKVKTGIYCGRKHPVGKGGVSRVGGLCAGLSQDPELSALFIFPFPSSGLSSPLPLLHPLSPDGPWPRAIIKAVR